MPVITYPGITGAKQLDGTLSVGITPGVFAMVCDADTTPAATGTLTIGDGTNPPVPFPNCMVEYVEAMKDRNRNDVIVRILDRRYRWKQGFPVSAHFNQLSERRKLIPWTVRSPWQLAYLLLTEMGELANAALQINLPPGLAAATTDMALSGPGDQVIDPATDFLVAGQNLPISFTNPPSEWSAVPAAIALQGLAETYGRLIVLDHTDGLIKLVQVGAGPAVPAGERLTDGISQNREAVPANVKVRGAPNRYQMRFVMRMVMQEWDGSWVLPERCSYAPIRTGQKMRAVVIGYYDAGANYEVDINGTVFSVAPGAQPDINSVIDSLAADINADPVLSLKLTASRVFDVTDPVAYRRLQLDGLADGYEFELGIAGTIAKDKWYMRCIVGPITAPAPQENAWSVVFPESAVGDTVSLTVDGVTYSEVVAVGEDDGGAMAVKRLVDAFGGDITVTAHLAWGGLEIAVTGAVAGVTIAVSATASADDPVVTEVNVANPDRRGFEKVGPFAPSMALATSRLSYPQARQRAAECMFRTYQVVCVQTDDPTAKKIKVPEYGDLTNQFRAILQGSRPEPVQPLPGDVAVIDPATGQPFAATTYNGYSTDSPNIAFGSIATAVVAGTGLYWQGGEYFNNTPPRSRFYVPFRIVDPEKQVIQFDRPVYRILGQGDGLAYLPPDLVIECGATVLDQSYAPLCPEISAPIAGGFAPDVVRVYADVQREVIGDYDDRHTLIGFHDLDADARNRAEFYAAGLVATYQWPVGQVIRYEGITGISLSGLVRQINFSIEPGGCFTTIGTNCEFSRVVPAYPLRRKAENLPQDATREMQNLMSHWHAMSVVSNAINTAIGAMGGKPA